MGPLTTAIKFILGIFFYFIIFIITFIFITAIMLGIFHTENDVLFFGISFLVALPVGVYLNMRFMNQPKKVLPLLIISIQGILACTGIGILIYVLFTVFLWSIVGSSWKLH